MKETFFSRQMVIFLAVAFGFTYLMGIPMGISYAQGNSVALFPNAQMCYPAAGVMLAALITRKTDKNLPRPFFIGFLVLTVLMALLCLGSVAAPGRGAFWTGLLNIIMMAGSILLWVLLGIAGKKRRRAYGLNWKNGKASAAAVGIFVLLYILRMFISALPAGQAGDLGMILASPVTWIYLIALPVNFFLVFVAFLGEEYGWRFYFQPVLQKRFGAKKGVLLLGVLWGLWHLPVNLFFYADSASRIQSILGQQVTCITIGIFFAWAYMKTDNIWVPTVLHFLNNNLIPIFSGSYSADVIEGQSISWQSVVFSLVVNGIVLGVFLFTRYFREGKYLLPVLDERSERETRETESFRNPDMTETAGPDLTKESSL